MENSTNANFELYLKKLGQLGINTEKLVSNYGELLEKATFSNLNDKGLAYEGSLIKTIMYKLTPYAIRINELYPEGIRVDKQTLVKVCLLHQIAKCVRFVKNDNEWEIKNRGMVYKFSNDNPPIRNGLHSLIIAQECGITFTAEEADAMTINDRDLCDDQARYYCTMLASIVRQANEMVYIDAANSVKK